ncbi:unnamed protein product [Candidula unifasciata]|uniref:Uncharacterized protein n=1 Tax=Candidula unifasciata TaxID=100452 RepID=A0A8S3YUJ2_9EUPU|nr:unnamed protein product [Candidula unifasciata]
MDPYGNFESMDFSSTCENKAKQAGIDALNEETYCADQLNVSGNSCDCAGYFEMPDCVMDVYLQALDGGDESNAALRNISNVYGPKDDQEVNTNCNHNVNHEPYANEGCGCTGSYNGGAGGGTAVCSYDPCGPYEHGFKDKKRDAICCSCNEDDTYQKGLVNKKPTCTDEYSYVSSLQGPPSPSGNGFGAPSFSFDDTYQQPLANKKPDFPDKYIPVIPQADPYCSVNDSSCCGAGNGSTRYALQRSNMASPDRSTFYADDSCDCHRPC